MSDLTPAARFYSRAEAEEFADLAADCGARVLMVEPKQTGQGFDMSLGALDRIAAFAVMVHPGDWDALEAALAEKMELDPHDPVAASPAEELLALVNGPRDANLPERVIARKVLASRPQTQEIPAAQAVPPADVHADQDRKTGKWLTVLTVASSACFVALMWLVTEPLAEYYLYYSGLSPGGGAQSGYQAARDSGVDPFAAQVKGFLPLIVPAAAALSVLLTRRQLKDGKVRPMFTRTHRIICLWSLLACIIAYHIALILALYARYHPVTAEG